MLEGANESDQRSRFLGKVNAAYADLQEDRKAWEEEQAERAAWDGPLADSNSDAESGAFGPLRDRRGSGGRLGAEILYNQLINQS